MSPEERDIARYRNLDDAEVTLAAIARALDENRDDDLARYCADLAQIAPLIADPKSGGAGRG